LHLPAVHHTAESTERLRPRHEEAAIRQAGELRVEPVRLTW
jgi:hypothetical protein